MDTPNEQPEGDDDWSAAMAEQSSTKVAVEHAAQPANIFPRLAPGSAA